MAGAAVNPPDVRLAYVRSSPVDPVYLEGEAVVGSPLPETVELQTIPDYEYRYVYVNGQPVLVDPASRFISGSVAGADCLAAPGGRVPSSQNAKGSGPARVTGARGITSEQLKPSEPYRSSALPPSSFSMLR